MGAEGSGGAEGAATDGDPGTAAEGVAADGDPSTAAEGAAALGEGAAVEQSSATSAAGVAAALGRDAGSILGTSSWFSHRAATGSASGAASSAWPEGEPPKRKKKTTKTTESSIVPCDDGAPTRMCFPPSLETTPKTNGKDAKSIAGASKRKNLEDTSSNKGKKAKCESGGSKRSGTGSNQLVPLSIESSMPNEQTNVPVKGLPVVPHCELLGFALPSRLGFPLRHVRRRLACTLQRGTGGFWGRSAHRASPPDGSRRQAGRQGHQMDQRPAARRPGPRQGQRLPFLASQGEQAGRLDQVPAPRKFFVLFYGTKEIGFVALQDLMPFTEEVKSDLVNQAREKRLPKRYAKGLEEALVEICNAYDELPNSSETAKSSETGNGLLPDQTLDLIEKPTEHLVKPPDDGGPQKLEQMEGDSSMENLNSLGHISGTEEDVKDGGHDRKDPFQQLLKGKYL
ncbi:hypothetical protein ACQ4PT_029190 [Festuca glaucescens]